MSVSINGTSGLVFTDGSTQNTSPFTGGFGFRNRIINGDMRIDQRNAGASVTASVVGGYTYTVDRWAYFITQASKFNVQRNAGSVTPPAGFSNYLGVTSTSAYTVTASDYFFVSQRIEGFNCADLAWGTANAATVTLSFWVRSSLTGAFGGSLLNNANNRAYPFSYTISSANTWEQKTITISGDTTGTWTTDNTTGIGIQFSLGVGSTYSGTAGSWASGNIFQPTGTTSVVGTNGATFYITGVQLEKGSTATSFDYRPYAEEARLCYRYYLRAVWSGAAFYYPQGYFAGSAGYSSSYWPLPAVMRIAPSVSNIVTDGVANRIIVGDAPTYSTNYSVMTSPSQIKIVRTEASGDGSYINFSSCDVSAEL